MTYVKSTFLTNLDSYIINDKVDGEIKNKTAIYEATGALADNTVIGLLHIPVDAKIKAIRLGSDDLGTTGDLNLGLYPGNITISDDTDAVDEDCFAAAIDVNAAAVGITDYRYSVQGIETIEEKAWELAGLSSKPDYGHFVVAVTLAEATTAGGTIVLDVDYKI